MNMTPKILMTRMGKEAPSANPNVPSPSTSSSQSTGSNQFNKYAMTKDCTCSTTTPSSSIDDMESKSPQLDNRRQHEEEVIRQKLSVRTYHLPGNNWIQDWFMYIRNNHLVFGLCCHHRLHPVTFKHRFVLLLGSLAFGLTMTNAVYLWYLYGADEHYNDTAFSITLGGDVVDEMTRTGVSLDISNGLAMLWTVGAASHAMFDLLLWHMIACGYCPEGCRGAGWNMAIAVVSICVAVSSFVVLMRAYEEDEMNAMGDEDSVEWKGSIKVNQMTFGGSAPDFRFLYGYLVELIVSLFVYTPIVQTLLLSGVLGCGRVPFLGGRPRSVQLDNERMRKLGVRESRV